MPVRTNTLTVAEERGQELLEKYDTRFQEESVYGQYEYDPESSPLSVLCHYEHTILSRLACNFNLWWVIFIYSFTMWVKETKSDTVKLPKLNVTSISMPMTLISFFVAFHAQSVWKKYHETLMAIHRITGLVYDVTTEISSYLSTKELESWELTRLVSLMYFCFYSYVADEDDEQLDFAIEEALEMRLPFEPPKGGAAFLCTADEFSKLSRVHVAMRHIVVRKWIMSLSKRTFATLPEYKNQVLHLDNIECRLQVFREACGGVIAETSRPIPMHYVHLVVFSVWVCTTMYAYAQASTMDSRFSWIPLLSYTIGIAGILEVCRCLSMPFGKDEGLDLPAAFYFQQSLKHAFEILMEEGATDVATSYGQPGQSADESTALLSDRNKFGDADKGEGCFGKKRNC